MPATKKKSEKKPAPKKSPKAPKAKAEKKAPKKKAPKVETSAAVEAVQPRRDDVRMLNPADLKPWPGLNPRKRFDPERMAKLEASIRERGVLQPLLVHVPEGDDFTTPWVVAGESRLRAAQAAGLTEVRCVVGTYTEAEALEMAIIENVERADLTYIEEARGYQHWMELTGNSTRAAAERFRKSQPVIANALRILKLPESVLALIDEGILLPSLARDHVLAFMSLREDLQGPFFEHFVKHVRENTEAGHTLSLQELTDALIRNTAIKLSRAIDKQEASYWGEKGPWFAAEEHSACSCGGPKIPRSSYSQPKQRCFDPVWWNEANRAALAKQEEAAAAEKAKIQDASGSQLKEVLDHTKFHNKYRYDEYSSIDSALLDPAKLAGAPFVAVESGTSFPTPYCVDPKAVKAAKSAAGKELTRRLREKQDALAADFLQDAVKCTAVQPSTLAFLMGSDRSQPELRAAGAQLGIDLPTYIREEDLKKLKAGELVILARLVELRTGSKAWQQWGNPVQEEIEKALRSEYKPAMKELSEGLREEIAALTGREVPKDWPGDSVIEELEELVGELGDGMSYGEDEGPDIDWISQTLGELKAFIEEHGVEDVEKRNWGLSLADRQLIGRAEKLLAHPSPQQPEADAGSATTVDPADTERMLKHLRQMVSLAITGAETYGLSAEDTEYAQKYLEEQLQAVERFRSGNPDVAIGPELEAMVEEAELISQNLATAAL